MRRPDPRTAVPIALVASLLLALLAGSTMLPAAGRPAKPETNRFGPSGVVAVDPDSAASAAASAASAGVRLREQRPGGDAVRVA